MTGNSIHKGECPLSAVIPIKGKTLFTINLDPSVWIFDTRKIDLDHYISTGELVYTEERDVSGSYGILFEPFLANAEPVEDANSLICYQRSGETFMMSLDDAKQAVLGFAHNGKPLSDQDGPIVLYIRDDSNEVHSHSSIRAIKQIVQFEVI